ncbi:uncharacterized protein G2W53_032135 [Senna tora]|uniref:Uncharacterized protein n=1 Tax=Senna tora TaxID=362788 RepID=A0A834WBI5_9FABA|nr:uncharacterized protein G2W53_032135 [Senna tora]
MSTQPSENKAAVVVTSELGALSTDSNKAEKRLEEWKAVEAERKMEKTVEEFSDCPSPSPSGAAANAF